MRRGAELLHVQLPAQPRDAQLHRPRGGGAHLRYRVRRLDAGPRRCCRSTSTASATSAWSRISRARCAPLLDFLGLPWDPRRCSTTAPAPATRGHVRTASYSQVGEPIYQPRRRPLGALPPPAGAGPADPRALGAAHGLRTLSPARRDAAVAPAGRAPAGAGHPLADGLGRSFRPLSGHGLAADRRSALAMA